MKRYLLIIAAALMPSLVWGQNISYDTIRRNNNSSARTFESPRRQSQAVVESNVDRTSRNTRYDEPVRQNRLPDNWWWGHSRWTFGGNIGFGYSDSDWGLEFSPQIGYHITNRLLVGGGLTYAFTRGRNGWDYRSNTIGINGKVDFYITRHLFLTAQPSLLYGWGKVWGASFDTEMVPCIPLGLGGIIPIGRGGITLTLYYDVLQHDYTPYGDRMNLSIGYIFRW